MIQGLVHGVDEVTYGDVDVAPPSGTGIAGFEAYGGEERTADFVQGLQVLL